MPTTTTNGLPIPQDSDALGDAALAVRNLANELDARLNMRAKAYIATTDQSIANNTPTAMALNAEEVDAYGLHNPVTNNSRFTISKAGRYRVTAQATFNTGATGYRQVGVARNASTFAFTRAAPSSAATSMQATGTVLCAAGDYLEAYVVQTNGAALAVLAGLANSWVEVEYVGAA